MYLYHIHVCTLADNVDNVHVCIMADKAYDVEYLNKYVFNGQYTNVYSVMFPVYTRFKCITWPIMLHCRVCVT